MILKLDHIINKIVRDSLKFEPDWSHVPDAVDQIVKEHQMHQYNYSDRVADLKGRIVVPTGGGKTTIQAGACEYFMRLKGRNVHLVVAPRLALCNQLSVEYRKKINMAEYIALSFHSGRHEVDYSKVRWHEQNTTNTEKVESEIARAGRLGCDLVIFTTYHSLHRLLDFEFDSAFFDESQYCTGKDWFTAVKLLKSRVKLFFTATEKIFSKEKLDENSRALNNEEVFGGIIYSILPKELIKRGVIVPPKLHMMEASSKGDNTLVAYIIDSVKFQHEHFINLGMPSSKTLVSANGTSCVKQVSDNIKKIKKELPEHTIYTIISDAKYGSMIDGVKVARNEFFRRLREPGNAIVVHYDIISEGIDIPGFTGIVLDRFLEKAKLLQSVGRCLRVYKDDPSSKPHALVTCPIWNGDKELVNWAADLITSLRSGGFEIMQEHIIFTGKERPGTEKEEEDEDKNYDTIHKIFDVVHRLEDENEWKALKKVSISDLIARMPSFK